MSILERISYLRAVRASVQMCKQDMNEMFQLNSHLHKYIRQGPPLTMTFMCHTATVKVFLVHKYGIRYHLILTLKV